MIPTPGAFRLSATPDRPYANLLIIFIPFQNLGQQLFNLNLLQNNYDFLLVLTPNQFRFSATSDRLYTNLFINFLLFLSHEQQLCGLHLPKNKYEFLLVLTLSSQPIRCPRQAIHKLALQFFSPPISQPWTAAFQFKFTLKQL